MAIPLAVGSVAGPTFLAVGRIAPDSIGARALAESSPSAARQPKARHESSAALFGAFAAAGTVAAISAHGRQQKRSIRRQGLQLVRGPRQQVAMQAAFDVNAWRAGFLDVEEIPGGYYILEDLANVPEDLIGTFYRNGPGKFTVSGEKIQHPLDGDGLLFALSFNGAGQAVVRHRLVQTQGLLRDDLGERITAEGFYGTTKGGSDNFFKRLKAYETKNTANAGVLWFGEKLMCYHPYGKPYLMETGALGTQLGSEDSGASDLGAVLETGVNFSRPKFCAETGAILSFSQLPSAFGTDVKLMEWPSTKWKPRYRFPKNLTIEGFTSFADLAVTPTFLVLAKPPVKLTDAMAATIGGKTVKEELLDHDAGGVGELLFSTRNRGEEAPGRGGGVDFIVPVDNLVCTEFANAHDTEDKRVVVDLVAADRWIGDGRVPDDGAALWDVEDPSQRPRTRLVRYEVNPKTEAWSKKVLAEDFHVGFTSVNPRVSGQPNRFVFCAVAHEKNAVGPMGGIAKVDTESGAVDSWVLGPTEFLSEPQFVPRGGVAEDAAEDDGYLITTTIDGAAKRSDVLIFDASNISAGPVCRFTLQTPLPYGTRGCWAPDLTFTPEEIKRKFVLMKMYQKKSKEWNEMNSSFNTLAGGAFFQKQGTAMR